MKGFDAGAPKPHVLDLAAKSSGRHKRKKYDQGREKKVCIMHFGASEEGRISHDDVDLWCFRGGFKSWLFIAHVLLRLHGNLIKSRKIEKGKKGV